MTIDELEKILEERSLSMKVSFRNTRFRVKLKSLSKDNPFTWKGQSSYLEIALKEALDKEAFDRKNYPCRTHQTRS